MTFVPLADRIDVRWPSGATQSLTDVASGRIARTCIDYEHDGQWTMDYGPWTMDWKVKVRVKGKRWTTDYGRLSGLNPNGIA
jgi:hypothetical protein